MVVSPRRERRASCCPRWVTQETLILWGPFGETGRPRLVPTGLSEIYHSSATISFTGPAPQARSWCLRRRIALLLEATIHLDGTSESCSVSVGVTTEGLQDVT